MVSLSLGPASQVTAGLVSDLVLQYSRAKTEYGARLGGLMSSHGIDDEDSTVLSGLLNSLQLEALNNIKLAIRTVATIMALSTSTRLKPLSRLCVTSRARN
ncbi:hypothetical protein BGZ96_008365 [Linnemannia gamsii]|uniref:Uncharacterized protein n=1 Tax=Linnemannia gamsii TaxID=64522 RepID=A0ABQ7JZC6_9FUNG|nr:hypothetical protein BGZ96_008365 [Linnemannia gamsii]